MIFLLLDSHSYLNEAMWEVRGEITGRSLVFLLYFELLSSSFLVVLNFLYKHGAVISERSPRMMMYMWLWSDEETVTCNSVVIYLFFTTCHVSLSSLWISVWYFCCRRSSCDGGSMKCFWFLMFSTSIVWLFTDAHHRVVCSCLDSSRRIRSTDLNQQLRM